MKNGNEKDWPSLQAYVIDSASLGFPFTYPPVYLECIAWGHEDFDAGGDGHEMAFLTEADIKRDLALVQKTGQHKLVPFARGDNGDALYCFDGKGSSSIYVVNLGEKHPRVRNTGCPDFISFMNDYRANMDLAPWSPRGK